MKNRDYVSRVSFSEILKEGFHVVHLIAAADTNTKSESRCETVDGKTVIVDAGPKAKAFPWSDSIDQIALLMGNDNGTAFARLNTEARVKAKNHPDMLKDPKYTEKCGYVCEQTPTGLVRLFDSAGTLKCDRIIESFLYAITDGKELVGYNLAIESAIANKTEFVIKISKDPWVDYETGEVNSSLQVVGYYAKSKFDQSKQKSSNSAIADLQA